MPNPTWEDFEDETRKREEEAKHKHTYKVKQIICQP